MKKILDTELEKEIIKLYTGGLSLKKISLKTGSSTSLISRILQDSGSYVYEDNKNSIITERFEGKTGYKWVAKCKKTEQTFDDFKNSSGKLTAHILKTYPDFKLPTGFKRRQVEKKTGNYWYEEFFDLIQIVDDYFYIQKKKCNYCDWETIDLDNNSGAFTSHLYDVHKISIVEHIQKFPDESILFKTFLTKNKYKKETLSNPNNNVECKICFEKLRKITNTHLKEKHNITLQEYRTSYGTTLSVDGLDKIKTLYDTHLKNHSKTFTSKGQTEIIEFVKNNNLNCTVNNKKLLSGIELDIVIEDCKVAIEYNGLLYHSELFGKKSWAFHQNKSKLSNNIGYKLIHIFEDEWINKKEIIKSKLLHILNKTPNKIHGRKCKIQLIGNSERNIFLDANHLLGDINSPITYGAFYKDELVGVMCFNNKRNMSSKKTSIDTYELTRFCSKIYYSIPGIANRLLKEFIKVFKPKNIVSFAEITWTNFDEGNVYTNMGFKMIKKLRPDYKYFSRKQHNPIKLHKFQFGKSSIKKKFPQVYDDNKTEWEMMQELGYDRIWDCGKWKYELDLTKNQQ